jgi:hypothetical protein
MAIADLGGTLAAVYQYEVHAGLMLQPNLQFICHPGGGAMNPWGFTRIALSHQILRLFESRRRGLTDLRPARHKTCGARSVHHRTAY